MRIGIIDLALLLVRVELAKSKSEARHLIKQGAVEINGMRAETTIGAYIGSYIIPVTRAQYEEARVNSI